MNITSIKWLLRREFWEHRGSLLWTPLAVGAALIVFALGSTIWAMSSGRLASHGVYIDGQQIDVANLYAHLTPAQRHSLGDFLASSYLAIGLPLLLVLALVAFFYCLGALHDERRDRSILFWKSLPLSDAATVLSKAATALVVAPLIVIGAASVTSLVILLATGVLAAFKGVHVLGMLVTNPALYLTPLQLVALLPIYVLWALPTVGWLLLVSSWARSKVFLWAVGAPLIAGMLLKWSSMFGAPIDAGWYMREIVGRLLGSLLPTWVGDDTVMPVRLLIKTGNHLIDMGSVVTQSYMTLARPDIWIGAIAGVAMLVGATRLRRWRDEA